MKRLILITLMMFLGFVILMSYTTTSATETTPEKKLNYQELIGEWRWEYNKGYAILTIQSITFIDNKFIINATYEKNNRHRRIGSKLKMDNEKELTGTIDPSKPNKIIFIFKNGGELDLKWDEKQGLWGYAIFNHGKGNANFYKEK